MAWPPIFPVARRIEDLRRSLNQSRRETGDMAQFIMRNPYPFIQLSPEGRIIFANPAACGSYRGLMEEGLAHPALAGIQKLLNENGDASREIAFNDRVWHQTVAPIISGGQRTFAVYCYDVTERKEFERELEKSRKAAESANHAKSDFLANMSHELRTPMNGIIGLSGLLAKMNLGDKPRELAAAVHSSAKNLLTLLNDILDFSKIEAGELTIETISFDLRGVIAQVEKLQCPAATVKNIALKTTIDENIPPYLAGDPLRLQQILNNLVGNALKFTEKGSVSITASTRAADDSRFMLYLTVRDTGIGIPKDKQESVFKKFTQADASTSRKYGGTGLGLSITRQLVELMKGTISLESEEGRGTAFRVAIPANPAAKSAESAPEAAPAEIDARAKILIVDDHPVNLLVMRNFLENLGSPNFDGAVSGESALALSQKNSYDLILMDCQMPGMDGFEAARRLREQAAPGKSPVIIAVTANAMKGDEEKCLAAGMNDYLSKPVEMEKLRKILEKWLPGAGTIAMEPRKNVVPDEDSVLKWSRLNEFTRGDSNVEREVAGMFFADAQISIAQLENSLRAGDNDQWERSAHKLYGSAANLGALALAEACDEAQSFYVETSVAKKEMLAKITARYAQLEETLQRKWRGA